MTWLGTLSSLGPPGSGGAAAYVRGQIISDAVGEGFSANQILAGLSAYGYGIARQEGLELVRNEVARQALSPTANQLDLSLPIPQLQQMNAPDNWTGQYLHQVTATWRERQTGGGYVTGTRTFGIKSQDILTPSQAVAAAQDILATPESEGGTPDMPQSYDITSYSLTGAWFDVRRPR